MNLKLALVAAGMALASTGVNAALVNLSGATVNYSFDDSFLSQANSKYNGYSLDGDALSFEPNLFYADSGSSVAAFATIFGIKVSAKTGYVINGISLHEDGYYFQTEGAKVTASAGFTVDSVLNPVSAVGLSEKETLSEWAIDSTVSVDSKHEVNVKVLNLLKAAKLPNGTDFDFAYIDKNLVRLTALTSSDVAPVPVPGAFWLFGSAFVGLLVSRRNTRAA
jgi:hypothetical protein